MFSVRTSRLIGNLIFNSKSIFSHFVPNKGLHRGGFKLLDLQTLADRFFGSKENLESCNIPFWSFHHYIYLPNAADPVQDGHSILQKLDITQ